MNPLTVKQLKRLCEIEELKGNGNKIIMISSDDEGNSYHYLWYAFNEAKEILEGEYAPYSDFSEKIASMDDTILLG